MSHNIFKIFNLTDGWAFVCDESTWIGITALLMPQSIVTVFQFEGLGRQRNHAHMRLDIQYPKDAHPICSTSQVLQMSMANYRHLPSKR